MQMTFEKKRRQLKLIIPDINPMPPATERRPLPLIFLFTISTRCFTCLPANQVKLPIFRDDANSHAKVVPVIYQFGETGHLTTQRKTRLPTTFNRTGKQSREPCPPSGPGSLRYIHANVVQLYNLCESANPHNSQIENPNRVTSAQDTCN